MVHPAVRSAAPLLLVALLAAGCARPAAEDAVAATASGLRAPAQSAPRDLPAPALRAPAGTEAPADSRDPQAPAPEAGVPPLPGIGPETLAELPAETRQVLVSSTPGPADSTATTVLYVRTGDAWERTAEYAGHNGGAGWKRERREGDRTSPIGVFSLSDAGGSLPDPGSLLPYTHEPALRTGAAAAYGEDYAAVFDRVIAIDYNRQPGTPPNDDTRPLGWDAGGKIWLHVDHDSPTRGCITVEAEDMVHLLRTLDPAAQPHIVMGPADDLAR